VCGECVCVLCVRVCTGLQGGNAVPLLAQTDWVTRNGGVYVYPHCVYCIAVRNYSQGEHDTTLHQARPGLKQGKCVWP
jgi:hypothetical protein